MVILVERKALKGILNGIILANLSHLTGSFVLITYAALIFKRVGVTHIDPYTSSIAIAIVQIIGVFCTSTLIETLGRRKLLICSCLGSACGLLSFALFSYLKSNGYALTAFEWLPVTTLSFVILAAASGVVPLTPICIVENLPSKVLIIQMQFPFSIIKLSFHLMK